MVTTNITVEPSRITIVAEWENVDWNIPSYHQAITAITRDLYKLVETKTAQEFLQENPVELEFENFTLIVWPKKQEA